MAYKILEQQIKSLPREYYTQVENFVNFMVHEAAKHSKKENSSDIAAKVKDIYSKIPEAEQTAFCNATLHSWRELTENDAW